MPPEDDFVIPEEETAGATVLDDRATRELMCMVLRSNNAVLAAMREVSTELHRMREAMLNPETGLRPVMERSAKAVEHSNELQATASAWATELTTEMRKLREAMERA